MEEMLKLTQLNRFMDDKEVKMVIEEYGTPLYVIDENTLHAKVKELRKAYDRFKGDVTIAYSIKANFNPSVIKAFMEDGIMFDIASLGELYFYSRCNGSADKVIYTSITEEYDEYKHALEYGIDKVVVSSYNGLLNLASAADATDTKPKVMVRINPEVGVNASIRASYRNGKFGVPLYSNTRDNASSMLKYIIDSRLDFGGFHFHLGSQITDYTCFSNALAKLDIFISRFKDKHKQLSFDMLDIGGGTPIFYSNNIPSPDEIADSMIDKLNHMYDSHSRFRLIVESGRYLTAESMVMLSKVVNVKEYDDDKYAILDSGYHLLLDAALLKQPYPQEVLHANGKDSKNIHLVGMLCDTLDIFPRSKASRLEGIKKDDYVIFYNVGAYSIVFNMPFHCQTKPAIIMKDKHGRFKLIRKAESIDRLFMEEGGDLI